MHPYYGVPSFLPRIRRQRRRRRFCVIDGLILQQIRWNFEGWRFNAAFDEVALVQVIEET
jgi:hypothetical protein